MTAEHRGEGRAAGPAVTLIISPEGRPGQAAGLRRALEAQTDTAFEILQARCCFHDRAAAGGGRRICSGPAIAMNLAAAQAGGDVLAFLAPDLEPSPDWVAAVKARFGLYSEARLVAGRTVTRLPDFAAVAEAALESSGTGSHALDCASSLHFAIRRQAFEELGGFDEAQPPFVLLHSPLGGLPVPRQEPVASDGQMAVSRTPTGGVPGFLRRQCARGRAAYYSRTRRPFLERLADGLGAPGRASRLIRHRRELAPVLALLPLGLAARLLGYTLALLTGGRRRKATPSSLTGPTSSSLVRPGESGRRPVASVVVPVHGCPDWMALSLAALARQDFGEPYELVVSLECDEHLRDEFQARFPEAHMAPCAPGAGPGGSRNAAIRMARGDYLAFTDDDCLPARDWLRRLVDACRQSRGEPVRGWMETAFPHSYATRAFHASNLGAARPRKPRLTAGAGGCNMGIARARLKQTDARFAEGIYGAEEMALLHELGVQKVLLEPRAIVRHLRRDGFRRSAQRSFRLGQGSGRLRRRLPLRGAVFARHVWLAPLLAPMLFALVGLRTLRHTPEATLEFVRLSPVLLARAVFYAGGFVAGALEERRSG